MLQYLKKNQNKGDLEEEIAEENLDTFFENSKEISKDY